MTRVHAFIIVFLSSLAALLWWQILHAPAMR